MVMENEKEVVPKAADSRSAKFFKRVCCNNAMANVRLKDELDMEGAIDKSKTDLEAMEPQTNLELLLASQMLSVHNYQQKLLTKAINSSFPELSLKYGNQAIKLSNVFIQQASLMNKLQNGNQQKVTFEHVHVHSGGQAIVGSVNTPPSTPASRGEKN